MQIAIVGLGQAGKTTAFNALTKGHAETGGYGGLTVNVGVVKVPDPRLDGLAAIFHPKKIVHADVTYVDLPAPPAAAEGHALTDELPAEVVGRLREADAFLHVARAFEDPAVPHAAGSIDALRDIERLDLEFVLADLSVADRRLERISREAQHGTAAEREDAEREGVLLQRVRTALSDGLPIRDLGLTSEEAKAFRGYRFLTEKPTLVLLNIAESDVPRGEEIVEAIHGRYVHQQTMVDAISAKIEMEIGELPPDEGAIFLADLGLERPGLDRVIELSYRLLGRISFLTAGPDEVRAWPIPDGSTALDAAGTIHSDLSRGFIRAEVVRYEDLIATGSEVEAKKKGLLRTEGRDYRVKDGDTINVLFKV
jgi:GTP-binding protein YchF